jgi:hypothetical protein
MTETARCDKLQQLEQKHLQLIEELDVLNTRLEQALESFSSDRVDDAKQASNE